MASREFSSSTERPDFYLVYIKTMVQTPLGAKSNPWVAYMKQCRLNYNSVNSEAKRSTLVGEPSETEKRTLDKEIKKKILKASPNASHDRVDDRVEGSSTNTTKTIKTAKTAKASKASMTLATFSPEPNLTLYKES